ncbi:MAG TPA: ABC transporter permease, partial [Gemmatimonadaceae bacterium]|nr:ABC transporter permease [Gemmatimonadaceae bacterium]
LAEALLLGVGAGAAGAALAAAGFRVLAGALPLGAWSESTRPDWTVFWAAMAIAVLAALLVACVPVVALWRGDLRGVIGRARTGGIGGRGGRLEGGLVVAEVALAVLMAAGAGLLVRSVAKLYAIDPGVDTRGIAVLDITIPRTATPERRRQMLDEIVAELRTLPGVSTAGAIQRLPLRGGGDNWGIAIEGRPELEQTTTFFRIVTRDYFRAMGVSVRQGRGFDASDRAMASDSAPERAVVVNEALARQYFPGANPIGKRIGGAFEGWDRIVGVVEDVAEGDLTGERAPARYMLYDQIPYTPAASAVVIRTARPQDAAAVLDAARRAVQRVAPDVAVQEATTMERVFARAVGPARQIMTLLALLGGLALVLGAVGVYGVISHFAGRRQRDWGIRVALGLPPSSVVKQVVGHGAVLVGIGVAIGLVCVFLTARLLASFLYGVGTADPVALAAAVAALLAVGLLAALVPAHRASRVDPAVVLRES